MARQRSNSFNDDDGEIKKAEVTTMEATSANKEIVTCFEDLYNELIYEIFEFLDFDYVHETFPSLNTRFSNLITNSTVPIKIHLSSITKSAFAKYNKEIIIPNQHRISSLRISNICLYDDLFSPIHYLSEFHRLETLQLLNIESKYLVNLRSALTSLPYFSSLTINSVDCILDRTLVYLQIFQLPTLKYFNCSLHGATGKQPFPFATNKYSPIEHLILHDTMDLEYLNRLVSYVPRLRRSHFNLIGHPLIVDSKTHSSTLNYLEHLSLVLSFCQFERFEQIIRNLAQQVEFLRITVQLASDQAFTDANRWERLILSHMPKLRAVDLWHETRELQLTSPKSLDQFTSTFWTTRRWFFAQQSYRTSYSHVTTLYSFDPYRRNSYILCESTMERTCLNSPQTTFGSVRHVKINQYDINQCQFYFPNATEVTLEYEFHMTSHFTASMFSPFLHLDKLVQLVVKYPSLSLPKLSPLLQFTPHLHTLIVQSASISESETFASVSPTHSITNLTIECVCTSDKVQLFTALCPRVQSLTITLDDRDIQSAIEFLLDKTNPNTRHLSSLCLRLMWGSRDRFVIEQTLNKFRTLPDDYMSKWVNEHLYVWC